MTIDKRTVKYHLLVYNESNDELHMSIISDKLYTALQADCGNMDKMWQTYLAYENISGPDILATWFTQTYCDDSWPELSKYAIDKIIYMIRY